ncbi:MAG: transglycosylase domain-containing protein [Taibaiella sp.]|nr:transglycosylase domain-containing protein [Taibaiella sp.]
MQHEKVNEKGRPLRSVRILWIVFFLGVIGFTLVIVMINSGFMGYMPSMAELENPSSAISSDVYAADGTLIGRYFVQDRSNSKYSEISQNVYHALLATEDARFYEHSGIDAVGTIAIPFYLLAHKKRGSSTITQQLAKNLFPRKNENMFTLPFIKLKEWVLAVKLERNLTKDEIITLYLNTVPFSDNVYGIRNASLTFFNKGADKLSVDEAAVLIGMLKGNTIYNPRRHPERSLERRNTVIDQMNKYNYITDAQAIEFEKKPIVLDYHKLDYHEGIAPYFRQVVEHQVKEACKSLKKPDGTNYDIYKDGLKIYTTLDVRMQRYAELAVEQHMAEIQKIFISQKGYRDGSIWEKHKDILMSSIKSSDRYQMLQDQEMGIEDILKEFDKPIKMRVFAWNKYHYKDTVMTPADSIKYMKLFLQAGFMVMDPFTGEVKAWVGGIDHTFFQYDHVNINTKRQVGSTIKPLLYCLAVDNGISPCSNVSTLPQEFPTMTHPYDAGGYKKFGPTLTMGKALALSVNNAALYLLKQVGINAFVDFVHKCGITSNVEKYPSSALGVSDISLFEMLGAYTMFPTGGIHTDPMYISRIEDKNGSLLKNFTPGQKELINANTAFKMVKLMRGVIDFGTGRRMRYRYNIKSDIAGKTGTTNKQSDAWFIGYTPQIIAGVWVGCEDPSFHFGSEELGQGSASALPIWAKFIVSAYADKALNINPDAKFKQPENFDDCDVSDPTSLERANTYNGSSKPADEPEPTEEVPPVDWQP